MTIDDATLMAYADGELDPLAAKRVEREMTQDPALARRVADHRALRERVGRAFAPIADEPVPDRLAALLAGTVVPLAPQRRAAARWWPAGAIAAGVALALGLAAPWQHAPRAGDHADGALGDALDTQLASNDGDPKMLVSFRNAAGAYCRVFAGQAADGIACRDAAGWRLMRTAPGSLPQGSTYRQAGSSDAALMTAAQAMMAGDPLDAAAEARARQRGWR
ncbi:MAG: anti-sigma factor family protein [Sphingomonas sp.]